MKRNFRALLKKFCLDGSVLGLKYFYLYPDRVSRCFWSVTMILTLCMACLLSVLLYRRFDEMPTRITIENQFKSVQNLPYPAITICTPNQITISALDHFNKTLVNGNLSLDLNKAVPQLLGASELLENVNIDHLEHLQDLIEKNRYSALNVMALLPQRCDQFLKHCSFQQKNYPCDVLFDSILTKNGMCCIFNNIYHFKDNRRNERKPNFMKYKATKTGVANALTVVTDYNPDDAVDGTLLFAGAAKVIFTDWTEFPGDDESSLVQPNAESFHIIYGTYTYVSDDVRQLPVSSRKCYFTDEFTLPHFNEYHNSDCTLACFITKVERRCQCTMMYVPQLTPQRACNLTSLACIKDVKFQVSKWYRHMDQCKCIRNCVSRRYRVETIMGNLNAVEHVTLNEFSGVVFNKSTTIMHFYFPSSVYMIQKQETVMSLISLASNLGGVFGLCLGCSFISLIEIWFYVYMVIKNYLRQRLIAKQHRRRVGLLQLSQD